ncbi:hypothetical protein Ssi03_41830 [Sphaerisporangium siamense]|uniref:Enoyl-CoA hydratase n=1 Tax=Sphaerisporangium siamense TaxID=795645 RepID=A0A7W7DD05_9ACTN|nr:enoyl-CoA hydratase/isomerase family protein [Sphaerisporangium siamense]MBB4704580.1 enoyl-CoA hydratase [Sphaerisporangium siamense]GII86193.1 hypothetical protein Ssi03_41830 [Sphaerisporangium siamense]
MSVNGDDERGRVVSDVDDGVLVLRLESPRTLNALSSGMLTDLARAIRDASDTPEIRGLVVTGTGDRAFSSGDDLRETRAFVERHGIEALSALFDSVTEAVLASSIPCVAAINGLAVGGAAELTLCFDRRIGSTQAAYRFPESAMGFTISNASSVLLPALVGRSEALDLVLSGRDVDAQDCSRIGLLDEVVAANALLLRCRQLIHTWTPDGNTAHLHLPLLRPALSTVQPAFRAERDAAQRAWQSGSMESQMRRFER